MLRRRLATVGKRYTGLPAGHEEVVRLLLEDYRTDVEAKTSDGGTALQRAASMGHDTVVRLLLEEEGADVEARTIMDGERCTGRPKGAMRR